MAGEYRVVPYKEMYEVDSAIELSEDLFDEQGDKKHVKMTILRRLTSGEQREREMEKRQEQLFEAEEEPEWCDEWTPLEAGEK